MTAACLGGFAGACAVRWMTRHGWPAWWLLLALMLALVILMYFDVKKMDDDRGS